MGKRRGVVLGSTDEEQQREELKKKKEARKKAKSHEQESFDSAQDKHTKKDEVEVLENEFAKSVGDQSVEFANKEPALRDAQGELASDEDQSVKSNAESAESATKESAESVIKKSVKSVVKQGKAKVRSKKYTEKFGLVDREKRYTIDEAIRLAKETSYAKFDATIEVHINLGIDTEKTDQNLRTTITLPNNFGKQKKVAAVVSANLEAEAKKAGADLVGGEELVEKIGKGKLNFDILVATPEMMPVLGKIAKILGPKGLMPNPKIGTVTQEIGKAITELKGGRSEFKNDVNGNIHFAIGKASMDDAKIKENFEAFFASVNENKPQGVKKDYIKSVTLCATMGPGIKISI